MIPLAITLPSGRVARAVAYARDGSVARLLATSDAAGRAYDLSTKQYPLTYEHIAKRLDALESMAMVELSAELRRVRAALGKRLRTAKSPKAFKALPRRAELEAAVRAMLDRAHAAGRAAIREEVPRAYAAPSFTPKAAVKWLDDQMFWAADVLSDDLLAAAQGILVNGMKSGTATSEMVRLLWEAFVPYLGSAVGEKVITAARLETIVRTNTTTAYNHGRLTELLDPALAAFTDGARYSAILDSRTTEVCRFLDGRVFRLPAQAEAVAALLPPRHFNCRSLIVPVMVGEAIDPVSIITDSEIWRAKQLSASGFAQWDEAKHPRHPAGDAKGGEFAPADQELLDRYVKEGRYFRNLNSKLRAGKTPKGSMELMAALQKLPVYEGRVYRGLTFADAAARDAFVARLEHSKEMRDAGFVSTSMSNSMAGAGQFIGHGDTGLMLKIESRTGRLLPVSNKLEQEVLFAPKTRFKVVRIERQKELRAKASGDLGYDTVTRTTVHLRELSGIGFAQRGAFRYYGGVPDVPLLAARVALLRAQVGLLR